MPDQVRGPSRPATAEIIARFANAGRDDPTIAGRLGITVAQVRGLRREFRIPPGETRWSHGRRRLEGQAETAATAEERTRPVTVPDIDPATATETEKLAWCKARAAAEPWDVAVGSVIQDMQLMSIPLKADLVMLMMADAMIGGERSVRDFIDGIGLGAIDREARSDG